MEGRRSAALEPYRSGVRRVVLVLVLLVATACSDDDAPEAAAPAPSTTTGVAPLATPPAGGVLVAWIPGGLPEGFAAAVAAIPGVTGTSVVLADTVGLSGVVEGHEVPVEVLAYDCTTWPAFEPAAAEALCALGDDGALLGETSAQLRDGDELVVGGRRLRVHGTVPDAAVGAAEVVIRRETAPLVGVDTARSILLTHDGDRAAVEAGITAAAGERPVRVRAPGEVPWLRHADVVLPAAILKRTAGEFGARRVGPGRLALDAAWREAHLTTVELPGVGQVTCNRAIVAALAAALAAIVEDGLLGSVDRQASGCWNARPIAGTDQPSRHAWGMALDVVPAPTDPRVIEIFDRYGFTWGGAWLTPDPVHFEFVRPPARSPGGGAAR